VTHPRRVTGVRRVVVRTREDALSLTRALAAGLRQDGWIVAPAHAVWAAAPAVALAHQHLVLAVIDGRDCEAACAWLRRAARVSPRAILAIDMRQPTRGADSGPPRAPRRGRGRSARSAIDADARIARLLIHGGHLERADAWLAALAAIAALTRCPLASALREQVAWVRCWQGRFEEAVAAVRTLPRSARTAAIRMLLAWARGDLTTIEGLQDRKGGIERLVLAGARLDRGQARGALQALGPAGVWAGAAILERAASERIRRAAIGGAGLDELELAPDLARMGAHGLARWGLGRHGMYLLHALPALLVIVNESEDERAALVAACAWARASCGADAVLFLGGDAGEVVAADGWRTDALGDGERRIVSRAPDECRITRPDAVLVSMPVRYGGARIGAVVVRGPFERADTMAEAAQAMAALGASALRGRLTTIETMRQGDAMAAEILGSSPAIGAVRDAVARAAVTPFPVLIEGESGTGKELVARALHRLSPRRHRRLATINCAALSDDLAEAELFGHTRGAFTGAVAPRAGLFEDAHGGTLFLDEVGELSPRAQAKLLRALQEREIRRVGENTPRAVDVRVIAATNRSLADLAARGGFRDDLLFRLAVVRLRLPPLRDRTEDVPLLAHVFWRRMMADAGKRAVLGADAVARLICHGWPGNVRELQNVVAGLVILAPARGRVAARHVEQVLSESGAGALDPPQSLDRARLQCERLTVAAALARHGGRRAAAARELGLTRQGLTKTIRRLRLIGGAPVEGVA
jgi:DNA-binding NtrC family response regulator